MTVNIVYADASDGEVASASASYATARAGTGSVTVNASASTAGYGQSVVGGGTLYSVLQAFFRWSWTVPAESVVTSAAVRLYQSGTNGASAVRNAEVRQYDFGPTVEAADFRTPAQLGSLPLLAEVRGAQAASGKYLTAGSAALLSLVQSASTAGVVVGSSRARAGNTPTANETSTLATTDQSGTATDPALVFITATRSTLFGVLGAQVRTNDGAQVMLVSDGAASPVVTMRRRTSLGAETTLATLTIGAGGYAAPAGWQAFALATNYADRLWLVGPAYGAPNTLAVQRFTLSGGVWSANPVRMVALPSHSGQINAVAVGRLASSVVGAEHDLFVMVGHSVGASDSTGTAYDLTYAVLNGNAIGSGSGSIITASGAAPGTVMGASTRADYWTSPGGEIGSGLDVATEGRTGYASAPPPGTAPGEGYPVPVGRYADGAADYVTTAMFGTRDAGSKVRVLRTLPGTVAVVTAQGEAGKGIVAQVFRAEGGTWTPLSGVIALDGEGIATMPAPATLATSPVWDAVYDTVANKIQIYYASADLTIRRTGISLDTYAPDRAEINLGLVGAPGSLNQALRVQRDSGTGWAEIITIANRGVDGVRHMAWVTDAMNVAPTDPALTPRQNFDASAAADFVWTFRDPNSGDTQSAYQLQIVNMGTGTTVLDTGKVVSATQSRTVAAGTLSNGVNYQWRVMTWDTSDAPSPWSSYGAFSTATGGSVTITDPAADNPAGVATDDYLVKWSVSGTVQAAYRVILVRVSDSATISDTGWLTSTATQHLVSGMATDVQYEVRVQARNAALVVSNTGTRRITPSYSAPEVPTVTLSLGTGGGYVLVAVANPALGTDRPTPIRNEILRRPIGGDWEPIGEAPVNGQYRDYTVASGVVYEFKARAVA